MTRHTSDHWAHHKSASYLDPILFLASRSLGIGVPLTLPLGRRADVGLESLLRYRSGG